jgi:regulator of sirC expression with transglutaminase-like and TPR domain
MQPRLPNFCNAEAYELFVECLDTLETNESLLNASIAISRHFLDGSQCESVGWNIASLADSILDRVISRTPDALVTHLHEVLFESKGLQGNSSNYYELENSLLPIVLDRGLGIPITLTLLYKLVAEDIGLQVDGINSPGHFLARVHLSSSQSMIVDAFHGGRVLTVSEAMELVTGFQGADPCFADQLLPVCTNRQWIARMLTNLQGVLLKEMRHDDVSAMRELLLTLI